MEGASFPREVQTFAALEQKMLAADLSLQDIETIGGKIVSTQTTDKTREIGQKLLNRLDVKREELVEKKLVQLNQTRDPVAKIKQLRPLMFFLPPEEIESQFSAIAMQASLLSGESSRTKDAVSRQLDHLRLAYEKPIFQELDPAAPHSFASEAQKVADAVLKTKSAAPLKEGFNDVQLKEVYRAAGGIV